MVLLRLIQREKKDTIPDAFSFNTVSFALIKNRIMMCILRSELKDSFDTWKNNPLSHIHSTLTYGLNNIVWCNSRDGIKRSFIEDDNPII